jgi:hypothetical protein
MGPICFQKSAREGGASFVLVVERKACYEVVEQTPGHVLIRDLGPWDKHPTITNAAEQVVEELAPLLNGRRLFYIDSSSITDELKHEDGKFTGFAAGGPKKNA